MAIIPDDDMVPIELCLLKPICMGRPITPGALLAQWIELHDPASWLFHSAHALSQDITLAGFLSCWNVMED